MKVHYTFDQANTVPCLARWRDTLQIQCMAIDPHTTVGVIDLQICLQAITQGSPELMNHNETDYTIYAVDFSEPDTPMVGQGMLSWVMSAPSRKDVKQLITGRVTRNKFSVFGHGPRETLEVTLQLKPIMLRQQQQAPPPCPLQEANGSREQSPMVRQSSFSASSETAEWNSFIRSNSSFGQQRPGASPTIAPAPLTHRQRQEVPQESMQRPPSIQPPQRPQQQQQLSASGPILLPAGEAFQSRPSSRNSARQSKTRGRPRKKAILQEGNTSGYEDGTEAEDGPTRKKRAKVTRVEKSGSVGFATQSESLRGVAIASESLRNIHPAGHGESASGAASHLQEVPRVPTPVPMRRLEPRPEGRPPPPATNLRRQSLTFSHESRAVVPLPACPDVAPAPAPHDARSPSASINLSPEKPCTPAESPADIASSPPIPRSIYTPHVPSSPVLPPMPSQHDSGFMSGGIDENRGEEPEFLKQMPASVESVAAPQKSKPKRTSKKSNKTASAAPASTLKEANMVMVQPGPATLLPRTSLYNPPPHIKRRLAEAASNNNNNNNKNNPPTPQPQPQQLEKQPSMSPLRPAQPTPTPSNKQELSLSASAPVYPPQPAPDSRAVPRQDSQQVPSAEEFEALMNAISPEISLASQTPMCQRVETAFEPGHNDMFDDEVQQHLPGAEVAPTPEYLAAATRKDPLPAPKSYAPTRKPMRESPARPPGPTPSVACTLPTIPASDPVLPPLVNLTEGCQAPCPLTDAPKVMPSKNYAKKQMIKDKLSEAVAKGELPTYCANCGAIETPTWRKMYYQEHKGIPSFTETSKEPGRVVSVDVLDRNTEGQPSRYRFVKKTLSEEDVREDWQEMILCNRKVFFFFFLFLYSFFYFLLWGRRCGCHNEY